MRLKLLGIVLAWSCLPTVPSLEAQHLGELDSVRSFQVRHHQTQGPGAESDEDDSGASIAVDPSSYSDSPKGEVPHYQISWNSYYAGGTSSGVLVGGDTVDLIHVVGQPMARVSSGDNELGQVNLRVGIPDFAPIFSDGFESGNLSGWPSSSQ